mmetsp:Transcript_27468/g.53491  ORF Transcript_27468/g.53491 Transcript_27468/m.53491 type:complete len:477 (-) Transcript_27468:89-1519(-)
MSEYIKKAISLDPTEADTKSRAGEEILAQKGTKISQHAYICNAYGKMLDSGKYSDLVLLCRKKEFAVHRIVLATQSSVFAAQLYGGLAESKENYITINPEYDPDVFGGFLRFLYTGEIRLHMNNIKILLTLADFYCVRALHNACFSFLDEQDFDMATLMGMMQTWSTGGAAIQGYLMSRYCDLVPSFYEFVKAKEFLTMNENVLIELLKLDQLCLEESEVLQAVISWGEHQMKASSSSGTKSLKETISNCMRYVRFELIDTKFIVTEVIPQKLISNERFVEIMQRKYSDNCPPPRRSTSFVAFDEKKRGIFYYIGSNGLKEEWRNPAKNGLITVTLSSSGGASRHCICDRKWSSGAVENSYGSTPTWIQFDLKNYQLVPRSYFVQQDQDHFLRNWRFEASQDMSSWTVLATYVNDTTITSENRFGHFKVKCGKPYRYFRIYVTGPSHKGQQSFDLTQVELFGRALPPKKKRTDAAT